MVLVVSDLGRIMHIGLKLDLIPIDFESPKDQLEP